MTIARPKIQNKPLTELYHDNFPIVDHGQLDLLAHFERLRLELNDSTDYVIPAKAGIHKKDIKRWIPAFAGMTGVVEKLRTHPIFGSKSQKIKGIYLWGSVGRGKTCLMDLFYDSLPISTKRRVHFHIFMQEIHARIAEVKSLNTVVDEIAASTTLLCFDEFQVTNIADAMIMSRFFGRLFEKGVVMVTTSNVEPERLYQGGLNREHFLPFISLLHEYLDVIHIEDGIDYRREDLKAPSNTLAIYWNALTQGTVETQTILKKGQRSLTVTKSKGDYAWFTFSELCAQPLGVRDYLLLSQNYKGIFMEGLSQLSPEDRNEAHRLMALVDVLYERKIPLYYNETVNPDLIYPEGEGAQAFARTASRLYEMRKWYENYDEKYS